jgi:hypothetical protein
MAKVGKRVSATRRKPTIYIITEEKIIAKIGMMTGVI